VKPDDLRQVCAPHEAEVSGFLLDFYRGDWRITVRPLSGMEGPYSMELRRGDELRNVKSGCPDIEGAFEAALTGIVLEGGDVGDRMAILKFGREMDRGLK
jgi:hypothetical protein